MQRIFIWGTGFIADQVLEQCSVLEQYEIIGFIDNDSHKQGCLYRGKEIFAIDILKKDMPDKIIVLTDYYDEIKSQITSLFPEAQDIIENKYFFHKQKLIKRYENSGKLEIERIIRHIKEKDLQIFNYKFVDKYNNLEIEVFFDSNCGMYFVYYKEKRLYFAKFLDTEEKIKTYYKSILIEQDRKSPHKYITSQFNVEEGDIVVDVGVAEGFFSLDIIDRVSKVYLIESNEEWIAALQETFKQYKKKIIIINKFVTSVNIGKEATLDKLVNEPVNFIKMDIEGNEWDALVGAEKLIARSQKLKCAVCSYHGDFDEILIRNVLNGYGLNCSVTLGYMWYPYMIRQTYISTRLCRGIVQARKNC